MGSLLMGRQIAQDINKSTKNEINQLKLETGNDPILAIITADIESSLKVSEIRLHADLAIRLGVKVKEILLDKNVDEKTLLSIIEDCNNDIHIHGILVLLPLPDQINPENILQSVSMKKELEGLSELKSLETVFIGKQICILSAILRLLKNVDFDILKSKNVFLIEEEILDNNPVVTKLLSLASNFNISLDIVTTKDENHRELSRSADLLLVSLDKPESVDSEYIKEGAIVIDFNSTLVGEEYSEEKARNVPILKSSLKVDSVLEKAKYVDPAIGGVGPIVLATLMRNFVFNWRASLGLQS